RRHCGGADRLARGHPPRCWCARLDTAVRVILHGHRPVPLAATRLKFPNWGWAAFDGAVTLLLGILLWADWPWSGFWFLGLSIGIALLLRGWSHVMIALALRSLPAAPSELRRVA